MRWNVKFVRLSVGGVVLLAILASVVVALGGARHAPSADELTVEQVCLQGVMADQTLAVRIETPGVVIKQQSIQSTDTSPVTDAQRQAMEGHAADVYARLYTGDLLTEKVKVMQTAIERYTRTDVRYFGGGVDWMTFTQVSISGNSARVSARAMIWAQLAQDQGNGRLVYATPHNEVDYTFTLTKVNGHWLITAESSQFVPGYEP